MLTARAWAALATSAFGFNDVMADMLEFVSSPNITRARPWDPSFYSVSEESSNNYYRLFPHPYLSEIKDIAPGVLFFNE